MNKEKYASIDEQLFYHIRSLQAGNMDSYTEVYNLSAKYLYKIIYDIVQDYHLTEDMLQEAFIKIYNNIGSLQSPEAYFVWAGRIATNLCIRHLHKYRKEVLTTATEDGEGNEEFIFDTVAEDNEMFIPESVLENQEHQRMIGEVIDSLSVEQKLAVQCFYFEEMSVKEIAALMECSEGTIKSRLNYARKSIKESILNIEKTQGTKLYSFGAVPVLLLIFKSKAQAAVPASALGGTGEALAGMYGSGGTITSAGAGIGSVVSGKLVAIIASVVIATGGIIGGTIWAVKENDEKKVQNETHKVIESESDASIIATDDAIEEATKGNIILDVVPAGGRYIVAETGEELVEGDRMPQTPGEEDCFYYGDYKYTYYYFGGGWCVELDVAVERQAQTIFGEIMQSIAGANVVDISKLFIGCTNMIETPYIPSGVLYMEKTFQECTLLECVTNIPEGVVNISHAFYGCENLVEVPTLPSSILYMNSAFNGCKSLSKTPNIPVGVTSLFETFQNCESIVDAPVLPEGIKDLTCTFSRCKSLVEAPVLPESVIDLGQTFEHCTSLTQPPVIPNNVQDMTGTFDGCYNLKSAPNVPYGVTDMAFTIRGCKLITTAPIIPDTVEYMTALFEDCTGLTGEIIIHANPIYYEHCFKGVDFDMQEIELGGSSDLLEELKATSDWY